MCLGPELILKSCLTNRMIIFKSFEEHLESITQTLINVKYIPTYNNYDKMNMKKKKKQPTKKPYIHQKKGLGHYKPSYINVEPSFCFLTFD